VLRNLTLSIDEELLRSARKVALDRNTSVNQIIRECLQRLVQETDGQRAAILGIEEIFRNSRYEIGAKDWTRDDLYER
jgi:uncharacterized protein DUF6364